MRNKYKGDDIRSRLHGTIIRYKEVPYLADVDSTGTIGLLDLVKGDLILRVEPDDPFIDISSIPLGYLNFTNSKHKTAVYLKREPLRRYKQGVEVGYLTQKALNEEGAVSIKSLSCQGLIDCVLNKYPKLDEALSMITKDSWSSVALSRDIAIYRKGPDIMVFIKDEEVGSFRLGTNKVRIQKSTLSFVNKQILEKINGWEVIEVDKDE